MNDLEPKAALDRLLGLIEFPRKTTIDPDVVHSEMVSLHNRAYTGLPAFGVVVDLVLKDKVEPRFLKHLATCEARQSKDDVLTEHIAVGLLTRSAAAIESHTNAALERLSEAGMDPANAGGDRLFGHERMPLLGVAIASKNCTNAVVMKLLELGAQPNDRSIGFNAADLCQANGRTGTADIILAWTARQRADLISAQLSEPDIASYRALP